MIRRKSALVALLLTISATAAALVVTAAGSARQSDAFKAAWIYVGPHNDGGWSQAHDDGRLAVQKALGSKVATTYKENVPEGPQVSQVIDSLVRDGNKIIFATSFGYQDAVYAAAKKYPDVKFEMATGTKRCRTWPSTTVRVRTRSTSPAWLRARPPSRASSATSSRLRSRR